MSLRCSSKYLEERKVGRKGKKEKREGRKERRQKASSWIIKTLINEDSFTTTSLTWFLFLSCFSGVHNCQDENKCQEGSYKFSTLLQVLWSLHSKNKQRNGEAGVNLSQRKLAELLEEGLQFPFLKCQILGRFLSIIWSRGQSFLQQPLQ